MGLERAPRKGRRSEYGKPVENSEDRNQDIIKQSRRAAGIGAVSKRQGGREAERRKVKKNNNEEGEQEGELEE